MARGPDSEEKQAVLLRTTADVLAHSLVQLEYCVKEWPQFSEDAKALKKSVDRIVQRASEYGYVAKVRR